MRPGNPKGSPYKLISQRALSHFVPGRRADETQGGRRDSGAVCHERVPTRAGSDGRDLGRATDTSDGVLPNVIVTLTGPVLLQPLSAVTSETGSYQFPRLNVGTYRVTFELRSFKTVVNDGIQVTVGFDARVNARMGSPRSRKQ